jgi:hypothetical protein
MEGTAYTDVIDALDTAVSRPDVERIVLRMDTPGGAVAGVDAVHAAVIAARESKEVIAENHGMIASAGYWIASAADRIVATSPSVETGSIGVIISQVSTAGMDSKQGINRVTIVSKNAPNKDPESDAGLMAQQRRADAIERVFIARIADGRNLPISQVEQTFGRGGLLVALDPDEKEDDAFSVGMIDDVMTAKCKKRNRSDGDNAGACAAPEEGADKNCDMEVTMKSLVELLAEHPSLKGEIDALVEKARAEGAASGAEKARVLAGECKKYLDSEYPEEIKKMAAQALTGEISLDTLKGCVMAVDILKAKHVTTAAVADTQATGATPGQQPEPLSQDGVIRNEADQIAAVARMRALRGLKEVK